MRAVDILFGIIFYLSTYDRQLSTRSAHKIQAALQSTNSTTFVQKMTFKENGTAFSCGLTRSWVSEVFEGLENQFDEYRSYQQRAGYENFTHQSLVEMFKKYNNSENGSIYDMKHLGTQDHDWVIWQLPAGQGYRILQSYNDAYSLKAWLSVNMTGLWEQKEIIMPQQLIDQINGQLNQISGGLLNLSNIQEMKDYLPEEAKAMLPYLYSVRDANRTVIEKNFNVSWQKYGQGRILSHQEFFGDYLNKTAQVMKYFEQNDRTTNLFPQDIYDLWIELYASPDPIYFPGQPNNFLSKDLTPGKSYFFQSKRVELPSDNAVLKKNMAKNAKLLRAAVETNEEF